MEDTRIRLNRGIADRYMESDEYKNNPLSLTQICNQLLEMYLDGRLVMLEQENFVAVNECAVKMRKKNRDIVNMVLHQVELIAMPTPKVPVKITPAKKSVKVAHK
jgi:hypothetical protein